MDHDLFLSREYDAHLSWMQQCGDLGRYMSKYACRGSFPALRAVGAHLGALPNFFAFAFRRSTELRHPPQPTL